MLKDIAALNLSKRQDEKSCSSADLEKAKAEFSP
jgi:hypothetical protein